jgi:hypothetical protein
MSQVTILEPKPITVKLSNGQTCSFSSNLSIETDELPIIDISRIYSEKLEERQALAEEIREASHRIGFFYIIGHVGGSSEQWGLI